MGKAIDSIARAASLFGLLGLGGLAGIVDHRLFAVGWLSYLSYACFFRFFVIRIPRDRAPILAGAIVPAAIAVMFSNVLPPWSGFIGFVGFAGWLIDRPDPAARVAHDSRA